MLCHAEHRGRRFCDAAVEDPIGGRMPLFMWARFLKQFAAVLIGSCLYFFVFMPHLPPVARHQPYRLDWGLLLDAWICLVLYGLIELATRFQRNRQSRTKRR